MARALACIQPLLLRLIYIVFVFVLRRHCLIISQMSFLFRQGIRTRVYSCVSKSLASVFATRRYAEDIRHPGFETGVWAFVGRQQSRGAYAKRVSSRGYHRPRYLHIAFRIAETHYVYSPHHLRGRCGMQRYGVRRTSKSEPHPISPTFLPSHSIRVLCCLLAVLSIVATNGIAFYAVK